MAPWSWPQPDQPDLLVSREIRKQSPLDYEAKVRESATRALRRVLSKNAVDAVLASTLNTTFALTGAAGLALFTPHLLSDIIPSLRRRRRRGGAATLVLNKADLKAFASVRGVPTSTCPSTPLSPTVPTLLRRD